MSKKTYRPYEPKQMLLLPPSLDEWLPADHVARFSDEVVDTLDLSPIIKSAIPALFAQVLRLCQEAGLVRGDELPDDLADRQSRLAKIQAAKAALEEEARQRSRARAIRGLQNQ